MIVKGLIRIFLFCWIIIQPIFVFPQLNLTNNLTPQQLVNDVLVGNGVSASNVTFSGSALSIGKFSNGSSTNIGMDEGVIISTGNIANAIGPNSFQNVTTNTFGNSDPQLASLVPGFSIFDAAILEFDFIPISDTLKLEYVFASDEYPEWVGSLYNDVFGFFVSGPNPSGGNYSNLNLATVPNTNLPVTVNNINNGHFNTGPCINCSFYVDNGNGLTIEYDGFTTTIRACLVVTPCVTYHIKIAIGDVGDHSYDSGIFLKYNSFSTNTVSSSVKYTNPQLNEAVEGCSDAIISFNLARPTIYPKIIHYSVGGTASPGIDYLSFPDSVIIPANSDSIGFIISPLMDGIPEGIENIILIVETSSCSSDTLIIDVSDYNPVSVNVLGPDSVCKNNGFMLSANISNGLAPFTYSWNTIDTTSFINSSLTNNGIFTVEVIDLCGYIDVDTHLVEVINPPIVTISASNSEICFGDSISLTAIGALNYNWTSNNGIFSSNDSIIDVSPGINTNYQVVGTNFFGCSDTAYKSVLVKSLPQINITASPSQICLGDSSALTASGAANYFWTNSNSLSANNLAQVSAFPISTTNYTVIGVGSNNCIDSAQINLVVNNQPTLTFNPTNPSHCFGQTTNISVSGAQSYTWNQTNSTSFTTGSSVNSSAIANTDYQVIAIDQWGCKTIDTVSLTVYSLPNVTVSPFDTSLCDNSSLVITAGGAFSYSWFPAATLSSNIGNSVIANPISSVNYQIIGTDTNGCQDTVYSNVIVSPNPILSPVNQTICAGDMAVLNATSTLSGTSFFWNTGSSNPSISVGPLLTTTYSVTATDTLGCIGNSQATVTVNPLPIISFSPAAPEICVGNSVVITASGANSYTWFPATGLSTTSGNTVIASPSVTTTYSVIAQNNFGCSDTFHITVIVNSLPDVEVVPDDSLVCISNPILLVASGANSYTWFPTTNLSSTTGDSVIASPSSNVNYVVFGTDANGCVNSDTAMLAIPPQGSISSTSNRICIGDSVIISANAASAVGFQWNTGSLLSSISVSPTITSTYSVTATDSLGCTSTNATTIIVDSQPIINLSPINPNLCSGASLNLTASGANSYNWYPTNGLSANTGSTVSASPNATTTFAVIGSSSQGCSDTAYATINIIPSPVVTVSPQSDTLCLGETSLLSSNGALNYQWMPSLGLSAITGNAVSANPISTTKYKVIGTSANGCKDSASANIIINPLPNLMVNTDSVDLCIGHSANINALGANNYFWSPAVGLSSTSSASIIATPNTSTNYNLIGETVFGCKDSMDVYVGIHPYPNLNLSPINAHLCPSDSILITVSGADSYLWSPSIFLSSISQDSSYAFPSQNTVFQVIGSTVFGCVDTAYSAIDVSPIINITPLNPTICTGDSIQITVNSNSASSTYLWSNGLSGNNIWVKPNVNTIYSVTATDSTGCSQSASKQVVVNANPALALIPASPGICPGDSVYLTVSGADSYNWIPSTGLLNFTGSSNKAFPNSTTSYQIIGQTLSGCVDTLDFQVDVFTPPNISVNILDDTICSGQNINLISQGAQNYQWFPSTSLNTSTNDSVIASPNQSTIYSVIGYDTNGCSDTAYSNIKVYTAPIISTVGSNICLGDTASLLSITSLPPDSLLWSTGAMSQSISVSPLISTNYNVTAYFPLGCVKNSSALVSVYQDSIVKAQISSASICPNDTVSLMGSNSAIYFWHSTNSVLLDSVGAVVQAIPTQNQMFIVEGTSIHGCKSWDSVAINLFSLPNISATTADTLVCKNDTVSLFATGGISYLWSPSNMLNASNGNHVIANIDTTVNFIVQGFDTNGCSLKDTVVVFADPGPIVYINPLTPILCQGDTLTLTGYGAQIYSWSPNMWINGINNQQAQVYPNSNTIFNLRGFNANGCYADTSVYVSVKRNPVLWVSPSTDSICMGDSIMLIAVGAGGNGTYNWAPTIGLSSSIGDTIWAFPSVNTTYQITGISTDGCSKSISSSIRVNPKPSISISAPSNQICINDSIQLTASGANNFVWSPSNSLNSSIGAIVNANPISTTNYTAIGTNQHGCSDSANYKLTVHSLPVVSIIAIDSALCFGDSTILSATGAQTYSWFANSGLSQNSGSSVLAKPLSNMQFSILATDSNNCKNADSIYIIVNPRPSIGLSSTSSHICAGDSIILLGQSNMNPTVFVWNTGDTASSLIQNPMSSIIYSAYGINEFGCDDSDSVFIQVNPYPVLSLTVDDTIICTNDSINIGGISSINPVNYLWSNNSITSNIDISPQITTNYNLIISDSIGCSDTAEVEVRVQPLPTVNLASSKAISCSGDSVNLIANASIVDGYQWNNAKITSSIWETPLTSCWYSATVIDSIGCRNTDSLFQFVNPIPQVSIQPTAPEICVGDSVNLVALSNISPVNFSWNNSQSISSIYVSPSSSTNYSVMVSDSIGCSSSASRSVIVHNLPVLSLSPLQAEICRGDSVFLSVTSNTLAQNILWSNNSTNSQIKVSPLNSCDYSVVVTDLNNCVDSISKQVIVYDNPIVNILPTLLTICDGDTVNLTVSSNHPMQTINWNFGHKTQTVEFVPILNTNYIVEVADTNGCIGGDTASVIVKPRPVVAIQASERKICSADSLLVKYKGTASNGAIYNWSFDGGQVLSGNGGLPHWVNWNNSGAYIISLTATENGCTSYPDTFGIQVFQTPIVNFIANPTVACESLNVNFQNQTADIKSYNWDFGNPLDLNDTSSIENPSYAYANAGSYTVSLFVISNDGCPAYDYKSNFIEVHKNPKADFGGYPNTTSILKPNISFWDFSKDAVSWEYNFGDVNSGINNISNTSYPWHQYTDTGHFEVQLVVMNQFGCTDTAYQEIYIKPFAQLYFPNAFTPNGDGLNDEFQILGHDFDWSTFELSIFDRWGKIVFQTTDIDASWNGKFNNSGEDCPSANYVFVVRVKNKDHKSEVFKGNLMLLK